MPRFRTVEVHPSSGWCGVPWIDGDPDGDARTGAGFADTDPAEAAREDLTALVSVVQRRTGLASPRALR